MNDGTNITILEDLTLVPVPVWWRSPWLVALVVLLLALAAYLFARWWKNRRRPATVLHPVPPGPPPHLEALRCLADLRNRHPNLDAYAVAVECAAILRIFIEARFALPIRYQTTREFLGAALRGSELSTEAQAQLGEFLRFFDQLKFARAQAQAEQTLAAIDGTEKFVRRCAPPEEQEGR